MIHNAERPILYAGGGVTLSNASEELRELAIKTGIPITVTLMGLGAFPETHPLAMEMPGMHGSCCANYAFTDSDLVVAIGARFDDRVTGDLTKFAPRAKKIHIDIDASCIGKNVPIDVPIVGDAKRVLAEMNNLVHRVDIEPWMRQINEWKEQYPFEYQQKGDNIMPQYVIEQIYDLYSDAIVVGDVGQHQMWAAQYFKFTEPRQWLNSGGLGTMGFSLPAAIGAQLGCPDKTVVNINGDGSYIMTIQELVPAISMNLPLKIFIINNMYLGMVRQWQELFHQKRYAAVDYHDNPDFAQLAEAFGATGIRVERIEDVRPALEKARGINDGPVVIDFIVDEEENVFPDGSSRCGTWRRYTRFGIMAEERHIFSVLVENRFGVLARIAGLFSGRGYNIDSLNVAETDDPGVSHMTIITHGDAQIIEQIYQAPEQAD